MSRQIIKQPNGKYCVFSTIVDNVIFYNMTPEDIIDTFVEDYRKEITNTVNTIINQLNEDSTPKHQFKMTYETMLEKVHNIHGEEEFLKLKNDIEE